MGVPRVLAALDLMKALKGDNGIVRDQSARHEGTLGFRDEAIQVRPQPVD